jgi:hypothetical protein
MIRVLTILAAVVALAVSAAPASAVNDGTSNTRQAAFSRLQARRRHPASLSPTRTSQTPCRGLRARSERFGGKLRTA